MSTKPYEICGKGIEPWRHLAPHSNEICLLSSVSQRSLKKMMRGKKTSKQNPKKNHQKIQTTKKKNHQNKTTKLRFLEEFCRVSFHILCFPAPKLTVSL